MKKIASALTIIATVLMMVACEKDNGEVINSESLKIGVSIDTEQTVAGRI